MSPLSSALTSPKLVGGHRQSPEQRTEGPSRLATTGQAHLCTHATVWLHTAPAKRGMAPTQEDPLVPGSEQPRELLVPEHPRA